MYIFVKVCLGSSYSIAVPDCNDTSSLEACNCIIRANSPVFTTFYFRFRHWAFWTKLIAMTRLKTFQYRLVWTCIHKKLIACHSPNFKICVGSRIILPVILLQPKKTDDKKRSNWPPDVNQIVFHWPVRRSIWKFTARDISDQWRLRLACASVQSHQSLCCSFTQYGGCPGWSESLLGAHLLCWFCHVAAHIGN